MVKEKKKGREMTCAKGYGHKGIGIFGAKGALVKVLKTILGLRQISNFFFS